MIIPEGITPTRGGGYTSYIFRSPVVGKNHKMTEVLSKDKDAAYREAKKRLGVDSIELLSFRKW